VAFPKLSQGKKDGSSAIFVAGVVVGKVIAIAGVAGGVKRSNKISQVLPDVKLPVCGVQ